MKLGKCPFCGYRPKNGVHQFNGKYYVRCQQPQCKVNPSTRGYLSVEQALKAWNKRVTMRVETTCSQCIHWTGLMDAEGDVTIGDCEELNKTTAHDDFCCWAEECEECD